MLEEEDMDRFYKFICMGKSLIEYAAQGDIGNFARLVDESEENEVSDDDEQTNSNTSRGRGCVKRIASSSRDK